jgi:hypothetical protein
MKANRLALFFAIIFATPLIANAAPIFNGHHYEFIVADGITWAAANTAAQAKSHAGVSGHLATITSLAEDTFLFNNSTLASGLNTSGDFADSQLWVGGFQPAGSTEPGGGWTWVNGEGGFPGNNAGPVYANWLGGEPNNVGGGEGHLAIDLRANFGWNDEGNLGGIWGYVVEYDVPEPTTLALLGLGLAGIGFTRRRRLN